MQWVSTTLYKKYLNRQKNHSKHISGNNWKLDRKLNLSC